MKPYGLRNKFKKNYKDCSPKKLGKGWTNWWEVELNDVKSKKTERQRAQKIIRKYIK